jgi:heme/copper-type cytochrome/quinol oxidase subunit 2
MQKSSDNSNNDARRPWTRLRYWRMTDAVHRVLLTIVIPLVLLLTLLFSERTPVAPTSESASDEASDHPDTMEIMVTGRHFEWWFRYPGRDGVSGTDDDFEIARRLVLPTRCDVTLRITSDDYIYSFMIDEWKLHEIAVPDMIHSLTFRSNTPAHLLIPVDSMCAFRPLHADTMGELIVNDQSWADFQER